MKKLLLLFPIVVLLATGCASSTTQQTPTPESLNSNKHSSSAATNYDIQASDLVIFFNNKFDCSSPKIPNSSKDCFNSSFNSKNVGGIYDNPLYKLVDFSGDGHKDALVTIYLSGSGSERNFFALTKDPSMANNITGSIKVVYEKDGVGFSKSDENWSDGQGNYFLSSPKTLNTARVIKITIKWDVTNKKFVEQ